MTSRLYRGLRLAPKPGISTGKQCDSSCLPSMLNTPGTWRDLVRRLWCVITYRQRRPHLVVLPPYRLVSAVLLTGCQYYVQTDSRIPGQAYRMCFSSTE